MTNLQQIAADYESAEVTSIFFHDRITDRKFNLLTFFELLPAEQQPSDLIGCQEFSFMDRKPVGTNYTVYATRILKVDIGQAIDLYENAVNGVHLVGHEGNVDAVIEMPGPLIEEPPMGFPILTNSQLDESLTSIFAHRNTSIRLWSQLNLDQNKLQALDKKLLKAISSLSLQHLGFDLVTMQEHIGNVYLFGCNPMLRKWDLSLIDQNKKLFAAFHERRGKSIVGCQLVIEEERSKKPGFIVSQTMESNQQHIELPYFPHKIDFKLYDRQGSLLEHSYFVWGNYDIGMGIHQPGVRVQDGEEVLEVSKVSETSRTIIGNYNHDAATYLKNERANRRHIELEASKEFIFFENDDPRKSRKKARKIVREILNKARKRCMILDPYFGAKDLVFAISVENISIPVQIVSSANFLEREAGERRSTTKNAEVDAKIPGAKKRREAHMLLDVINDYKRQFPAQRIECRVLRGEKSPLHDRYIIVDEQVYLLGSSLNEFGSRTTTIIRVPTPAPMIVKALDWWDDEKSCPELEDYIASFS